MAEHVGGKTVDDQQLKTDRLRRLYSLHDPMATSDQIDKWIAESIESNDEHGDAYEDQIARIENQIAVDYDGKKDADVRRIDRNGELYANVSDLATNLQLDKVGRVRYAIGATAMGVNMGGKYAPQDWLKAINDHAEEIRDHEEEYRTERDMSDAEREDRAGEAAENAPFRVIDNRAAARLERKRAAEAEAARAATLPTPEPEPTPASTPEPEPESASAPAPVEQGPLTIAFIDQTHDALAAARDAAEARRREELQTGGKFRRFIKSMWKGENGLAGAYYLEKYKKEALQQIQSAGDIYTHESTDADKNKNAQLATIERFQSEYEESIHRDAGEQRVEFVQDSDFSKKVKELIGRYVSGDIADASAFEEERGRIVSSLESNRLVGEGKVRIDNTLAIAEQVKAMVDHGQSLDDVLEGMKIYTGESRSNVRSETKLGKVERTIERLQKTKLGGFVNPETIGAAAAVALGVARAGRGTLLRAAGVTLVPGVLGGALSAVRENKRIKEERVIHSRESAQGKQVELGARREQMEKTRYETIAATDLTDQLEAALVSSEEKPLTEQDVQQSYELIAGIEARIRMSDAQKIDLVSYSDVTSIEKERQKLDEARALAKVRLKQNLSKLPDEFKQQFGIKDDLPVNDALKKYTDASVDIVTDVTAKDEAFRKLRRRRVAQAAATGAATSFVMGVAAQEALAVVNPHYDGLIEHAIKGESPSANGTQTVLEGLAHGGGVVESTAEGANDVTTVPLGTHGGELKLPAGYEVWMQDDGTFDVVTPNEGETITGLVIGEHGLTEKSMSALYDHGISVLDSGAMVAIESESTKEVSVADYNKAHTQDTTHIKRDFWYDNNTARFDKNELGLDWGANKGIGDDKSFQFSVARMTEDGSRHNGNTANWASEAKDGSLKLAISGSIDTQSNVYMVDVNSDGTVSVPADHPASAFFSVKDGQASFNGGYVEVVEVNNTADEVVHVSPLATIEGDNSVKKIEQPIPTKDEYYVPKITLEVDNEAAAHRTVEGFGVPGVVPRKSLEVAQKGGESKSSSDDEYNPYSRYEGMSGQEIAVSPRLEADPTSTLVLGDELKWYNQELEKAEGADYVRRIEENIQQSPELKALPAELRTITTIPVAAANESDNIYKTLSLYSQQDAEQLKKNAILLNVNWLDTVGKDPAERAKIDKTIAEIERARKDFPELRIATMTREYEEEAVKKTGGVIGYVARDLMNTALIAINKRIEQGKIPHDADIAVVRQDADMLGMSRHYLKQLEKGMDSHPGVDIFQGVIRSDVQKQERYPGLGIVTNFSQSLSLANAAENHPWTVGINTVARAASLAAVGGLGRATWTGPASDDVNIAYRITGARSGVSSTSTEVEYYRMLRTSSIPEHRVVVPVSGMAVDSSADRLLPQYLEGRHFGAAWDSKASKGTSFMDGPGGYRDRTADVDVVKKTKREKNNEDFYRRIETNFSAELRSANETAARRVLSIFFAGVPNAYTIRGDIGSGEVKFQFTDAGREFIKKRVQYEVDGSRGAGYGARKMRQLYGQKRGGRRPQASESPFIAPVKRRR